MFRLGGLTPTRTEHTPAKCYLETRIEQVEESELQAEMLSDVVSLKEEQAVADPGTSNGKWRMKRARVRGTEPRTTEQLMSNYNIMAVHRDMVAQKHATAEWIKDFEVWELRARDRNGNKTVAPS